MAHKNIFLLIKLGLVNIPLLFSCCLQGLICFCLSGQEYHQFCKEEGDFADAQKVKVRNLARAMDKEEQGKYYVFFEFSPSKWKEMAYDDKILATSDGKGHSNNNSS